MTCFLSQFPFLFNLFYFFSLYIYILFLSFKFVVHFFLGDHTIKNRPPDSMPIPFHNDEDGVNELATVLSKRHGGPVRLENLDSTVYRVMDIYAYKN